MTEMSEERLSNVEATQARMLAILESLDDKIDTRHEEAADWQSKIDKTLYGDGNGHKGMNVRLDRLEQTALRAQWNMRLITTAVATLLGRMVFVWVSGTGG